VRKLNPNADPKTTEAYTEALRSTFFHWGFHAWAVYGVVAYNSRKY
jgi:glycine betaine transporter